MAATPTAGNPGADKVGGHSFNMSVHDSADPDYGFENFENACNTEACHGAVAGRSPNPLITEFNRLAFDDYDGDGAIQGEEIASTLADSSPKRPIYPPQSVIRRTF